MLKYGNSIITTTTDDFGRKDSVTSSGYTLSYTYKDGSASHSTTNLVDTMTYELDEDNIAQYTYTYDANGNITQVKEGNTIIASYLYDNLNQLLSVNYRSRNLYFTYHYDNSGNITSQSIQNLHPNYGYPIGETETITYTYGDSEWKDKLTKFNDDNITYDAIGNPLSYRDGMSMDWQNGRELASITKPNGNDTDTYTFKYNLDGLRTEKNINGTKTYYYYDSNNNLVGMKKGSDTVLYYYDSDGGLVSMSVGDSSYLFVKNLQGDITKIVDDSGNVVATYAYDAWGKILSENEDNAIAGLNPFRYRGYVYDPETELYYLQSRYYDPLTGRFLNADDSDYTDTGSGSPLSTNMFAYCENDPISGYDPSGNWNASEHRKMTKRNGFKGDEYHLVRAWVMKADSYPCKSTNNYSTPFHGRNDALSIATTLYNKAMEIKKNKKKIKVNGNMHCLHYNNRGDNEKTKAAQKKLIDTINDANGWNEQSQILLGLSLHTMQDFFAHVIRVDIYGAYNNYYPDKGNEKFLEKRNLQFFYVDDEKYMGLGNAAMEDNINVLRWRYRSTNYLTEKIYEKWENNKFIKTLTAKPFGRKLLYRRTTGILWWKKYWSIYYKEYTITLK